MSNHKSIRRRMRGMLRWATGPLVLAMLLLSGLTVAPVAAAIPPQSELSLNASVITPAPPTHVNAGSNVTIHFGAINNGPDAAPIATLQLTLPANTSVVSLTANQPGWAPCSGNATADCIKSTSFPATPNPGSGVVFTLVLHVGTGAVNNTPLTVKGVIGSANKEVNLSDNTAQVSFTVDNQVNLSITKTSTPNPVAPGAVLNYTITIHNAGPNDAVNATLLDKVPSGTTFLAIDQDPDGKPFTCTTPGVGFNGDIRCTRASFAAGGTKTFFVAVKVNDPFNGTVIDNTATIGSDQTVQVDTDLNNNSASTETTVNPPNGGASNPNGGDDGNGGSGVCTATNGQSVAPSPLPVSQVIQATPGTVPFASNTTLINVNAGQPVQVRVSVNGDDDHNHIFVGSLSGTINAAAASFIESGSYVFTAYGGPTFSQPLGSVVVSKLTPNGTTAPSLVASPCTFHFVRSTTNLLRTTHIDFGSGDGTPADVTVSVNGGPETLVSSATFGSFNFSFIESGQYTFRLKKAGVLIGLVNVKTTSEIASSEGSTSTGNANVTITPGEFALLTFDTGNGKPGVLTVANGTVPETIVSVGGDGAGFVTVAPSATTTYNLHIGDANGPLATNGKITVTVLGPGELTP